MKYSVSRPKKKFIKIIIIMSVVAVILVGAGVYVARQLYFSNLKAVSGSQKTVTVTIPMGSSLQEITEILHKKGLIKSSWAFQQYIRNNTLQDKIQAGTYAIKPSQDVETIAGIITEGRVATDLVTIAPGQRIDQIEQALINDGFSPQDVQNALKPGNYSQHPALVDKPVDASLEGYLYPESFHRTSETTPADIIEASLDEMALRLTPELRASFAEKGLGVHKAVILASIIEREVAEGDDRPTVAQVFLKRLSTDMKLESDATAGYGAILAGDEPSLTYESPYNTYYNLGLPPGPISNISESSLEAVARPSNTDWIYFVSGDDGKTYFSKTLEEHEAFTKKYCTKLCN